MNETYRNTLRDELGRAVAKLTTLSPGSDSYNLCIEAIRGLSYLSYDPTELIPTTNPPDEQTEEPTNPAETPTPTPEPEPEPTPEPTPTPEPEPKPVTPAPKPEPRLTKQEVISRLTYLANNGVDVAAVMGSLGFNRLSDVPESRYAELLDAANSAAGGDDAA